MSKKIFYWLPRALCITAILFISMFALDAFESNLSVWTQIRHFMLHLTPSYILICLLLIAWKWEKLGGFIFLIIGLAFTPVIFNHNYHMNHSFWISSLVILAITVPFVLVGILFLVSNYLNKRPDNI